MSVMIVTSLGDMVVDLYVDKCPLTTKNFLKLCKIKYYNGCLFHTVQKDFTAQTGDPTGTGSGGDSVYKFLYGDQARFFSDEIHLDLKHSKTGTVAMASAGENLNASQFYITLRDDLDYLDGKHTVFGEIAEGLETLTRINEAYVDEKGRPYKNIRIKHTYILDDPFDGPPQLNELIPDASPEGKPKDEVDDEVRLEDDWVPLDEQLNPSELEEIIKEKEAHSRAVVLESIGDIPDVEVKPPENVLFVCKLNPVTEDEDLHTIFSRFGTVTSAEIIRDYKTGDSLCYAFIEFEDTKACEQAYFKMDNALIDDRRIHVDFSQSVSKLWNKYRRKEHLGAGQGCFKCGSLDHIAKDCTVDGTMNQPSKYILKDNNAQHGGDNSRYDMVFDEDNPESPRRGTKNRGNDRDDQVERKNMSKQSSRDHFHRSQRDQEMVGSNNRDRYGDRSRGQEGNRSDRRTRDEEYHTERKDREKHIERRRDNDNDRKGERDSRRRSIDDSYGERRSNGDHGRTHSSHVERRDDSEYKRDEERRRDDREYKRDEGEWRKRSSTDDGHGDYKKRYEDGGKHDTRYDREYKRDDGERRKRSSTDDGHGDYKRPEDGGKHDMRDEPRRRKRSPDEYDDHRRRKEEHGHRRRDDDDRRRKQRGDR